MQTDIFGGRTFSVPSTQGIKYAGSKLKILPYIADAIDDLDIMSVLDGFSGSTRVSQLFAKLGYNTTSSDISYWSEIFGKTYLLNTKPPEFYQKIIDHLNQLKGYDGWFTQNYGSDDLSVKKTPFQTKNTRKLDAIRDEIDRLDLDDIEKSVVLSSLILALDAVDSTLGHFVGYLGEWSPRSHNDLLLKVPNLFISTGIHTVNRGDIFDTLDHAYFDLVYLDPPYGSNNEKMPPSRVRYGSYYHIWKTVILNDHPDLFGKVGRREDSRDTVDISVFEEFRKNKEGNFIAMEAIKEMIERANAKYVLLSYSSGGRATKQQLYDILNASGELVRTFEIDHKKNVMGTMRWTNEWINSDGKFSEYLFLLKKSGVGKIGGQPPVSRVFEHKLKIDKTAPTYSMIGAG